MFHSKSWTPLEIHKVYFQKLEPKQFWTDTNVVKNRMLVFAKHFVHRNIIKAINSAQMKCGPHCNSSFL